MEGRQGRRRPCGVACGKSRGRHVVPVINSNISCAKNERVHANDLAGMEFEMITTTIIIIIVIIII